MLASNFPPHAHAYSRHCLHCLLPAAFVPLRPFAPSCPPGLLGALSFMLFNYKCGAESKTPRSSVLGPELPQILSGLVVTPVCLTDGDRRLISSQGLNRTFLVLVLVLVLGSGFWHSVLFAIYCTFKLNLLMHFCYLHCLALCYWHFVYVSSIFLRRFLRFNWSMMEMQYATDLHF